jgi:hypothetical protein
MCENLLNSYFFMWIRAKKCEKNPKLAELYALLSDWIYRENPKFDMQRFGEFNGIWFS